MIKINIYPAIELGRRKRLFDALAQLYSVDFAGIEKLDQQSGSVAICFGIDREQGVRLARMDTRCMVFLNGERQVQLPQESIHLGTTPCLYRCFHGRVMPDKAAERASRLNVEAGEVIVAQKADSILWIHRKEGETGLDLIAMDLPEFADNGYLFDHFHKHDWLRLLPLLHFVQEVSGWQHPGLRACFMFDDPNLHWKTYGYVNYSEIAAHGAKHHHHVSFATVPLDGWYSNPATAAVFKENKQRLSLLIHGNNHTLAELAQKYSDTARQTLTVQAIRRIEKLERTSGVKISRVMAAPHGACSHDMATALLLAGFEAACISRGSIMAHNPAPTWPATVGLNMTEFLGSGLPTIPRFRLQRDCLPEILFAAFLGQPIIPVGHHEDLAGGLDLLKDVAGVINSIGDVGWMNMESVTRSNFCTRQEGELLQVKMYSRKIRLKLPQGVRRVSAIRPWLQVGQTENLSLIEPSRAPTLIERYHGQALPVAPEAEIELSSPCVGMLDIQNIPSPWPTLWVIARRHLCEVRDRIRPLRDRLRSRRT